MANFPSKPVTLRPFTSGYLLIAGDLYLGFFVGNPDRKSKCVANQIVFPRISKEFNVLNKPSFDGVYFFL